MKTKEQTETPMPAGETSKSRLTDENHFQRTQIAEHRSKVLAYGIPVAYLPSTWEKCVQTVHRELGDSRQNVAYASEDGAGDAQVFTTCVAMWGQTHINTATILLDALSISVPIARWRELIKREIEHLTRASGHLSNAVLSRNEAGASCWYLSQVQKQIAAAIATHVKLMEAMMVSVTP